MAEEGADRINKQPRRSRSKRFFTSCFRRIDLDGEDRCRLEKDDGGSSRVSPSLNVGREGGIGGCKKRKDNKSLARALKAVFLKTFLVGKFRKGNHVRRPSNKDPNSTRSSTKKDNTLELTKDNSQKTLSSPSIQTPSSSQFSYTPYSLSQCSSLSSSSSIKSNSRLLVMVDRNNSLQRPGHVKAIKRGYFVIDSPLFLLLIAILIFIVLGKIYAIFCTLTCLYFVPRWSSDSIPPNNGIDLLEIDSKVYKKGIIMGRLLQR